MNADLLATHLQISRYGSFTLTDAIRPALDVPVRPREGYRVEVYRDRWNNFRLPTSPRPSPPRTSSTRSSRCSSRWATKCTWCSKAATGRRPIATRICAATTSTCRCC